MTPQEVGDISEDVESSSKQKIFVVISLHGSGLTDIYKCLSRLRAAMCQQENRAAATSL